MCELFAEGRLRFEQCVSSGNANDKISLVKKIAVRLKSNARDGILKVKNIVQLL